MATMKCPCQSNLDYASCCKPYHSGSPAPSALLLMRSRYSAYALCDAAYIMQTTHPQNPDFSLDRKTWEQSILIFCNATQFLGLKILNHTETTVTFHAKLKQGEEDVSFTEKSLFEKVCGNWLYKKRLE